MEKNRLEAFSDGVIAIIITIMVLELKAPHGDRYDDLLPLIPVFLNYVLSFVYVAIYWNNHHHMLHASQKVTGRIMWANMHWLFWLSLIPFATAWMGENHFATLPVIIYGVVLLMSGAAYYLLSRSLMRHHDNHDLLEAFGRNRKAVVSIFAYMLAILLAFFYAPLAIFLYAVVAVVWFIPDKRIEKPM